MKKTLLAVAAVLFGMNMSAQNLISNSTFDTDAIGWSQYTRNGGSIAIFQVEEGILHVKSNGAGDNAIDANLKNRFNGGIYTSLPSLAAQKYTLTLDICAMDKSATRTFSVAILKDVDLTADGATTTANNVYLSSAQTINTSTDVALITLRFDITLNDAAENAVLALGFTANSAEWYIDNIYLTPAYLGNPGFETTYNWSKSGMTFEYDAENMHGGVKSGKYTPTPDLEKEFYQCRLHAPVTYLKTTDNKVTVRFWAKGAEGGEVVYGLFYDGDKNSSALGLSDYLADDKKSPKEGIPMATLTTEWAPYTFVFEGTDNMVSPSVAFSCNETGKTFWIDDIVMFAENDPTLGISAPAVADNSGIKVFAAGSQVFVASDAAATVNVYSMTTGVLFDSKQITEGNTVIDLAKGAYIIQVVTNGKSVSEKVIIR